MRFDRTTSGDPGNDWLERQRAGELDGKRDLEPLHGAASVHEVQRPGPDRKEVAGRDAESGLSPERLTEIRKRILDGAYDSLEAVDRVARRIIERGDI
jgi:hypothetical protein